MKWGNIPICTTDKIYLEYAYTSKSRIKNLRMLTLKIFKRYGRELKKKEETKRSGIFLERIKEKGIEIMIAIRKGKYKFH